MSHSMVHVWPEADQETADGIERAFIVECPGEDRRRVWYRIPNDSAALLAQSQDWAAIAAIFVPMARHSDLHIHGTVSPSLMENLEEFSFIWARWRSGKYFPVRITADSEHEATNSLDDAAISAFSGGVDGCFTAYRHATCSAGRQNKRISAALLIHGFDIPREDGASFTSAKIKAKSLVESIGLQLIAIQTNWRDLDIHWEDGHATGIISCMSLISKGFAYGIIGSTEPYETLIKWGSTPITDPLLSSNSYTIRHDGAGFSRTEKVALLAEWPEACEHLRVCWEGPDPDRNCGLCEKCIRTILNFRAAAGFLPPCFPRDVSNNEIEHIKIRNATQENELRSIIEYVEQNGQLNEP